MIIYDMNGGISDQDVPPCHVVFILLPLLVRLERQAPQPS